MAQNDAPARAGQPGTSEPDSGLSLARWSLVAIAALLPLATSNFTWLGFAHSFTANQIDLIKLLVLQLGLVAGYVGLGMHVFGQRAALRATPAHWVALAALALTTVSALLSVDVAASVLGRDPRHVGLVTLADFIAVFFLASQVLRTRSDKRLLAYAVAASSTAVAAYGVLQYVGIDPVDWGERGFSAARASSTFGNPVPLGAFLAGSLVLTAFLALTEGRDRLRLAEWASFALQSVALVVTFSRGAWLGAGVGLAVLAFAAWRQRVRPQRSDWIALAVAAVLVGAVVVVSLTSQTAETNVVQRISETTSLEAGNSGERVLIWQTAARAIGERPLQGWGPEAFRWAYARLRPAEAVRFNGPVALADDAHDYPLQLAVTLGVPAALVTLALFGFVAWLALDRALRSRAEQELSLEAGYLAAMIAVLVCLVAGISSSIGVALLWLYAGVLVPTTPARSRTSVTLVRAVAAVGAVLGVVALIFVVGFVRADSLFVAGRRSPNLDERLRLYAAASAAQPRSDVYAQALGNTYGVAAEQAISQARQAQAQGQDPSAAVQAAGDYLTKGIEALQRATLIAPLEPANHADLARLYLLSGTNLNEADLARASSAVDEALRLSPNAPYLLVTRANVLVAQKRPEEAVASAEEAVALYTDANTLAALGQARLAAGDASGAVEAYTAAVKLAPSDSTLAAQLEAAKAARSQQ